MPWWWLWCCLAAATPGPGTEAPRPRIGLVLGGGGARGLAHLGVLQWLEEHRIPVDAIAGTSMGGLVAGLYAGGLSPAQMRELMLGLDWDELLRTSPRHDSLTFRRKEDRRDYPTGLEFGLRGGVKLPAGLIEGQAIGLLFSDLALEYVALNTFDDLPIPFRCVATNLVDGRPVVLDRGSLPEALRATMSIPGVFTPVRRGDQVLVDGALLNNVPTDVPRQMGADLVIAVDVGTPLGDKETLASLTGIIGQSVGVMVLQNVRESLGRADLVIVPDMPGLSAADWRQVEALIGHGYRAAASKQALLRPLGLDPAAWEAHLAARQAKLPPAFGIPTFVEAAGNRPDVDRAVARIFRDQVGRPVDPANLGDRLTELVGNGRFEWIGYRGVRRDGALGLRLETHERTYGPPFANAGLHLVGGTGTDFEFALRGRVTAMDWTGFGSEWRTDLTLGSQLELRSEYYQPLPDRRFFVAPRIFVDRRTSGLFQAGARLADYRTETYGCGGDVGFSPGRDHELRLGVDWQRVSARVRVGPAIVPPANENLSRLRARWVWDSQDDPVIATRGARCEVEAAAHLRALGSDQEWPRLRADLHFAWPLERDVLFAAAALGTSFASTAPVHSRFTWGGPFRGGAYDADEFRGSHFLTGAVGYLHRLPTPPFLVARRVYFGGWYELGSAFERVDQARYRSSLTAGVMADTALGPATLAASYGEGGRREIFLALGRAF